MKNAPKEPKNIKNTTAKFMYTAGSTKKIENGGYILIRHIITGAVKFTVNDEEKILFSGDTLILNSHDECEFYALGEAYHYAFVFDMSKYFDILGIPALTTFANFIHGDNYISHLCEKINEEYENQSSLHENMLDSLTNAFLIHLYRNYSTEIHHVSSSSIWGKHKIARLAVDYIYNNCQNGITTSEISKFINVSTSHLCRCFKEATGVSVIEYAERIRCRKAKEDLSLGIYSVTQIAEKYHFNSLSYFNRRYKKYCGTNPAKTLAEAKKRRSQ
jgi:AraC-like DNA-binding protein